MLGTTASETTPAQFDQDGFLVDPQKWSRGLAQQIAGEDGIGTLTEAHWAVIQQLREHFFEHGALVPASHACRVEDMDPACVPDLFKSMRQAWRIAGLPNPGEEAKNYM